MALQTLVGASMTTKTFQIFKPGTHTTMGGNNLSFTQYDLHGMASAFSERVRPAPLVLGHPQHDSPAMGWVKSLNFENGVLYATADFGETLVEHVKAKRYTSVSAAFLSKDEARNPTPGKWYLRHIGFLGAHAPALKDLVPVTFAEFSWSTPSPVFGAQQLEVAFAEAQKAIATGDDQQERQAMHELALQYQKRHPEASYAHAAGVVFAEMENRQLDKQNNIDPDRSALHKSILSLQASTPGMTYAEAAHRFFR